MTTPDILQALRRRRPLVHCVSNQVSANDCANLLLALGASPIMARAPEEAEAITAASAATVLNTGTPEAETFRLCRLWGQAAAALGQPVVLDPVGVGASPWRLEAVEGLLAAFTPALLRVNLGEARALLHLESGERGVDGPGGTWEERAAVLRRLAQERDCAVLLSGPEDLVTGRGGGGPVRRIAGGSPRMAQVTGTGCMLSALCGAVLAVEADCGAAAWAASVLWKACARRAEAESRGPGSFRAALMDAAAALTAEDCAAAEVCAL